MKDRDTTFAHDVAVFILNEARRDLNRLGYSPVEAHGVALLIHARRAGLLTRAEMLTAYRIAAGRPA